MLVLVLFGLRHLGLQREFQAFDHPLMEKHPLWVVARGGGSERFPPYTRPALESALELDLNLGLELPLHRSNDGVWFVFPSYQLSDITNGSGFPEGFSWDELSKLEVGHNFQTPSGDADFTNQGLRLLSLKEVAAMAKNRLLILTFNDPKASYVEEVATLLNSLDLQNRIIIRSPFTKFVREMKKIEPMWVYGSDTPSLSRAVLLSSFKIETLASLKEDIVISGLYVGAGRSLTPSFVVEIKRQKKPLIFESYDTKFVIPHWLYPELDGIITDIPASTLKSLRPPAP